MVNWLCFISFLVVLLCLQTTQADQNDEFVFTVSNKKPSTRGGWRFKNEIDINYCQDTMINATKFILKIFQTQREQLTIKHIQLIIDDFWDDIWFEGDNIGISTKHIEHFSGDLKREITGLLYQLMVHTWQGKGNGNTPLVLIQGIAGFVRIKAGYVPNYWKRQGSGGSWYERFDVTAWFLKYCDDETQGFVASLNNHLNGQDYRGSVFVPVFEQRWIEYKAKYNQN